MINKQEALDAIELYRRNMAHILGEDDEKVKVIEMCIRLVEEIEDMPSAQSEIIRCGKCKHRDKRYLCDVWDEYITNEDFYCGCAERREE